MAGQCLLKPDERTRTQHRTADLSRWARAPLRSIVPASRPQLAHLDVPKWPPLLALIATACSGGLSSAGWQGNRLGSVTGSSAFGRSFHTPPSATGDDGSGSTATASSAVATLRGRPGLRSGRWHLPRLPTKPLGHRRSFRRRGLAPRQGRDIDRTQIYAKGRIGPSQLNIVDGAARKLLFWRCRGRGPYPAPVAGTCGIRFMHRIPASCHCPAR